MHALQSAMGYAKNVINTVPTINWFLRVGISGT